MHSLLIHQVIHLYSCSFDWEIMFHRRSIHASEVHKKYYAARLFATLCSVLGTFLFDKMLSLVSDVVFQGIVCESKANFTCSLIKSESSCFAGNN